MPRPRLSQGAAARTLRFVPQANLANFDPIWGTQYVVRNASAMVWDLLYGVDEKLEPQPQMVEADEVSADGLTWTFRLREGLRFHDNEPVLAKDVVASITRWMPRDPMGQMLARRPERAGRRWTTAPSAGALKKPFPKLPLRARQDRHALLLHHAGADRARPTPSPQITEYVGSGPMRFVRNEWVPGARAAFERFAGYQPRPEPGTWLAGGKRMGVDRVEWHIMPDPATASAALQNGEVDWWENPHHRPGADAEAQPQRRASTSPTRSATSAPSA